MIRVGLIDRFPLIFLDNTTHTVSGQYSGLILRRIDPIIHGLNVTWSVAGNRNRGCLEGVCRQVASNIQSNRVDLCSESSQLFLFDAIYPNISLSPPVLELDCAFLSYVVSPPSRRFNDILTTLQVFNFSTIILLLILLSIAFIMRNYLLWISFFHNIFHHESSGPILRSQLKITFPKIAGSILSLVILQFQSWYSASFQTNLVSWNDLEPVKSIPDLVSRDLRAYVSTTSNCYRGLLRGKEYHLDSRVNNSLIILRNAQMNEWAFDKKDKLPLAVFFGNSFELNRIRKMFSDYPDLFNPTIIKVKSTKIQDIYMYSSLLPTSISNLILTRFHKISEANLFWDKNEAVYAAESRAQHEFRKSNLIVGFQTLKMENYEYITKIYLLFLIISTIIFFTSLTISKLFHLISKSSPVFELKPGNKRINDID